MDKPKTTFIGAVKAYFGLKPGQKLGGEGGLGDEINGLSDQDYVDVAHGLVQVGTLTADGCEKSLQKTAETKRPGVKGLKPSKGYSV